MEEWKLVPSVPGLMASSEGRVMVIPFEGVMPHGGIRTYGGKPRIGCWVEKENRYIFQWKNQGKNKTYKVAKLVCEAFNGPYPFARAVVMHLDENSRNNKPGNLQWGTQKENLNAPGFIEYCKSRTGENNPLIKGRIKHENSSRLG